MTYFTKQVAEMLGVQPVTVRSWGPKFEERGHVFLRDERGSRAFTDADIALFKRYLANTKEHGMTQEAAIDDALATPVDSTELAVVSPGDMNDVTPATLAAVGDIQRQVSQLASTVTQLTEVVHTLALRSDENARNVANALRETHEQIASVAVAIQSLPAAQAEPNAPKREYWWSRMVRDFRETLSDN